MDLRLLSFNILRDRRDERAWAWSRRCELVIEVIGRVAPDVIAFQEVAPDMRDDLAHRLPEYAWVPRVRDTAHDRPLYVGDVAYRKRAFTLENHELVICEPGAAGDDGWPLTRWPAIYGGTWAQLRNAHNNEEHEPPLTVWSVHLPHQSAPLRQHYADRLITRWHHCAAKGMPFFVAGDFNDQPGSPLHQCLTEQGGLVDMQVHTGDRVLDWILVGGDAISIASDVIDLQRDGVRASDHPALSLHVNLQGR